MICNILSVIISLTLSLCLYNVLDKRKTITLNYSKKYLTNKDIEIKNKCVN